MSQEITFNELPSAVAALIEKVDELKEIVLSKQAEAPHVVPKTNTDFWLEKIGMNKARDLQDETSLTASGWKVITIWECELKKGICAETLSKLERDILCAQS